MADRIFITLEEAERLILTIDEEKLELLVDAVNLYLETYVCENVTTNPLIKIAAIKIIEFWGNFQSILKAITDVDVHKEFNADWADFSIPPEAVAILSSYKADDAPQINSSFDFL